MGRKRRKNSTAACARIEAPVVDIKPSEPENKDLFFVDKLGSTKTRKERRGIAKSKLPKSVVRVHLGGGASEFEERPLRGEWARSKKKTANRDLWDGPQPKPKTSRSVVDPSQGTALHKSETGQPLRGTPKHRRKPVGDHRHTTQSISLPHPGASINPEVDTHNDAIDDAREADTYSNRVHNRQEASSQDAKTFVANIPSEDSDASDSEEEVETIVVRRRWPDGKRKTTAQRNKQKRHNALLAALKHKKRDKGERLQLKNLRSIKRKLRADEAIEPNVKPAKRRRLGKFKYEAGEKNVALPEELTDEMRTIIPVGNLFRDLKNHIERKGLFDVRRRNRYRRHCRQRKGKKAYFKTVIPGWKGAI